MKHKHVIIWMLTLLMATSLATAVDCSSSLVLETIPSTGLKAGDTNAKVMLTNTAPVEGDLWDVYTAATLYATSDFTITNAAQSLTSLSTISHAWDVDVSSSIDVGLHNLTAVVQNDSGIDCNATISVTVTADSVSPNPSVSVSVEDLTELTVNEPYGLTITLTNAGSSSDDIVYGLNIITSSDDFTTQTQTKSSLGTTIPETVTETITPIECSSSSLTVSVTNFRDLNGQVYDDVSAFDTFNIVGSDLRVVAITPSNSNPSVGEKINLTATVEHFSGQNAKNAYVEFYLGSVDAANLIETKFLEDTDFSSTDEENVTIEYTVQSQTNTFSAQIGATNECPSTNNILGNAGQTSPANSLDTGNNNVNNDVDNGNNNDGTDDGTNGDGTDDDGTNGDGTANDGTTPPATPPRSGGGSGGRRPQCDNNVDDDGDGLIDWDGRGDPTKADPGCTSRRGASEAADACVPDWQCLSWNVCSVANTQRRECRDLNNCGTEINRPAIIQQCTFVPGSSDQTGSQTNQQTDQQANQQAAQGQGADSTDANAQEESVNVDSTSGTVSFTQANPVITAVVVLSVLALLIASIIFKFKPRLGMRK